MAEIQDEEAPGCDRCTAYRENAYRAYALILKCNERHQKYDQLQTVRLFIFIDSIRCLFSLLRR